MKIKIIVFVFTILPSIPAKLCRDGKSKREMNFSIYDFFLILTMNMK